MKGLILARQFFEEQEAAVRELLGDSYDKISIGLAGQGSECLGFDDELSMDHDFGPGFCIWLGTKEYEEYGEALIKLYDSFPKTFQGVSRITSAQGHDRVGVLKTDDFYFSLLGTADIPQTPYQWYSLSEERLAMVTNGEIFHGGEDQFMRMRSALQDYYPEPVRKKKLAGRFAAMSQSGQYNYPRCVARNEKTAAYFALNNFMKNAISAIFLLNRKYTPFYKWMQHGLGELPVLGNLKELFNFLSDSHEGIVTIGSGQEVHRYPVMDVIGLICSQIGEEALKQNLITQNYSYMEDAAKEMINSIEDETLRILPIEMNS